MTIDKSKQDALTETVLNASRKKLHDNGPHLRQLLAKDHGLVSGKFVVDEDISEECKAGVFAQPHEFDIWIRLS